MKAIGLISGTSVDGIDAVIVDIPDDIENHDGATVEMLGFATYPYPSGVSERILNISASGGGCVEEICRLNGYVGELFARAAIRITEDTGIDLEKIDVIGSHGQTVQHLPHPIDEQGISVTSTLQIGEPSIIAERTGVTTVADFRPRDMAAGGEGAPFAPYAHYLLFRHPAKSRIVLNIGGISNVTYLAAGGALDQVIAFDTGPGNLILDQLVTDFTNGAKRHDNGGQWAARGTCHQSLLEWMLTHPYFHRKPPKSTGREEFGPLFMSQLYEQGSTFDIPDADLLATATMLTVETIVKSCYSFLPLHGERTESVEMLVGGGGVKNDTLMTLLQQHCAPIPVCPVERVGGSSDALEAITFALLARATLLGKPSNLPAVTGAAASVLLGKIVPGRRYAGILTGKGIG